ncbi:MAG: VOC family protein [Myxococcota bacterium]
MADNPPRGVPQLYPRLAYRDPTEAVVWLTRAFGLAERESARLADADGNISLTEMQMGKGQVMIGRAGVHDLESPATLGGRTQMVMAYVDEVDAHYTRAREAGARIVMELEDLPWGDRRYEALDLEGHRWYFAEHVRDVSPEDWKQAVSS